MPNAPIVSPNLGLYYDRPSIALSPRMLEEGFNFRIEHGKLSNLNLGWDRFESGITLNGPVTLIDTFTNRDGTERLIFGSLTDLYLYSSGGHSVTYITPIYATGTVAASGTGVTGTGTSWNANVKAGDQMAFGSASQTSVSATWFTVDHVTDNTHLVLTTSAGTVSGGTAYTVRKLMTGALKDILVSEQFLHDGISGDDLWFVTNGIDNVIDWNGSGSASYLPALGFTCKTLRVYSNMMIYGNLVQSGTSKPTDIINSDAASPTNVSSGISEQFKVHGGVEGIKVMRPIGDALAIYSKDRVTVAQFVGDPTVFAFRQAISTIGCLSARGVADFGNYHEFIGTASQYRFDGASVIETGKHVWREVLRTQDPTRTLQTYSHFDNQNAELIWVMPLTTDSGSGDATKGPAQAVVEHWLEQVQASYSTSGTPTPFSRRSFPFTATGHYSRQSGITWAELTADWASYNFRWNDRFFFAAFPFNLAGDINGKIYTLNTAQNADGAALAGYVRFGRRAVVDGRIRGLVSRIYPFVTKLANSITVTLRLSDHSMGPNTINADFDFDQSLPEGGHFVSSFRRGRYMQVEFGSSGPDEPWELSGYDVDIRGGGSR